MAAKKAKKKVQIFPIVNTIIMILFVIITLYPVLNTLAISLNDGTDSLRGGIYLLPRKFTWKNYITVLQKDNLITGAYVTVARTVIGTVLALISNAILAFIVSRKRFMFKKQLSLFWVITMYVNGGLIPTFLLYKGLGLTNSFWVYVIPGMVSAFNMLVIRTYMNGIPDSLEESAQLDGAGYTTIFLKIYSPLCKPVYATVALFVAVGQWNSWFDAMLYNRMNGKLTTLQYELMKLLSSVTNTSRVYVIPGMVSAFNMLVIRTYMNGIPDSLEESAQLDGAGYTTIFLKIYSPLCKPVYATVALFVAVGQWNSWFDAMLYNRMNGKLTTLQYELMKLLSSVTNTSSSVEAMKNAAGTVTPTSVRAAATIITILPIICIYPFLQKYFVTGLTLGGVKE